MSNASPMERAYIYMYIDMCVCWEDRSRIIPLLSPAGTSPWDLEII